MQNKLIHILSSLFLPLILFLVFFLGIMVVPGKTVFAQNNYLDPSSEVLAADIDLFFQKGAKGYLVWQYSGNLAGTYFANDQWSFFQTDTGVCEVLKQKSQEYPDKFVGVNMYDVGSSKYGGAAAEHMTWLKQNCGVSVIRIFAKVEGVTGVGNALRAAESSGVKLIVAVGDYSNGGGGVPSGAGINWYKSGYKGEYRTLAHNLAGNFSHHPALFGFELANEPHCSGDASAIEAYKNWGVDVGNILGGAVANVGYGQMASQDTTRCDSTGPEDFTETNSIPQITMTSAHFYTPSEKASALLALEQSNALGKMFYIGEAPPGSLAADNIDITYNLEKYPEYNVKNDEFYLGPIAQVLYPPYGRLRALRKELGFSGYEAYCAAENVIIEPQFDTDSIIRKFLEQYPEGILLKTESTEELNYEEAKYPLWRDVSGKQFLFTSIEEYFGFKDVYETDPALSEINSGAINSLLSNKQACEQGWKNLNAQLDACNRLTSPDECALFPRPIPGTDFTVKTLIKERKKFAEFALSVKVGPDCDTLLSGNFPQWDNLKDGLINTPSYFDRAYRYGFVVAVIHTTKVYDPIEIFNFFTKLARGTEPRDEVLVAAFKLPDIGTNKGNIKGEHISVAQFWRDPLDATRKVLSTVAQDEAYKIRRNKKRNKILGNAINAGAQNSGSRIFCYQGPWPPADGTIATDTCKNELPLALTDIINGNAEECGDTEAVNIIKDLAGLGNPYDAKGKVFTHANGGQVLVELFKTTRGIDNYNKWKGSIDPRSASDIYPGDIFKSKFPIVSPWPPEMTISDTTVDFYLVYPVGFELKEIEETLKGTFFSTAQIESMEKQATDTKFEMSDQIQVLHGGSAGHEFEDTEKTANHECGDDEDGDALPCMESFSVSVSQGGSGMSVLGGRLGWWLRQIQTSLNSTATDAYHYFKSCGSTEKFLLGKCK